MQTMNKDEREVTPRLPSIPMWAACTALATQFLEACGKETSLVKARKKLKNELEEMGNDPTIAVGEDWTEAAANLKRAEIELTNARDDKIFLADKLSETVLFAKAGRDLADTDMATIMGGKKAGDAPLFAAVMAAAKLPAEDDPNANVGEPNASKPDPLTVHVPTTASGVLPGDESGAGAIEEWRYRLVENEAEDLKLKPAEVQALRNFGLVNLGDVERFIHEEKKELGAIEGMTKKGATSVFTRVNQLRDATAPKVGEDAEAALGRKPRGSKAKAA